MTRQAAAYLRRSSVSADSPGDASKEVQQAAVRRLAAAFAPDAELREFTDWGISGRRADRPEYVRLKEAIGAGRIGHLFAYSLSRLGRTARELDDLFALCEAHDVPVMTQADGTLSATSATGRFLRRILSELAELESELARERTGAANRVRVARGDKIGQAHYGYRLAKEADGRVAEVRDPESGDPDAVVAAYREAGSLLGCAKLLQDRGVPAPKGGRAWSQHTVMRILEHEAPDAMPRRFDRGRRPQAPALLSKLLRCHCGTRLTPNHRRGQYYCYTGNRLGAEAHGRLAVAEADLLPWVQAEAARLTIPADRLELEENDAERREALARKRERWIEQYGEGLIEKAERDRRLAAIEAELDTLDAARTWEDIPQSVDWTWPPEAVNAVLRALWSEIRLGPDLLPLSATWRVPRFRAD